MSLTSKQRSKIQEDRIAQDVGGKVTPASGARWGSRRDVRAEDWLVEAKTTKHPHYRLDVRDLQKLQEQAYLTGRLFGYVVEFQGKGSLAIVAADILPDNPHILIDAIDQKGWRFRFDEVVDANVPFTVRLSCGVYCVIPYRQFIRLTHETTP